MLREKKKLPVPSKMLPASVAEELQKATLIETHKIKINAIDSISADARARFPHLFRKVGDPIIDFSQYYGKPEC